MQASSVTVIKVPVPAVVPLHQFQHYKRLTATIRRAI